MGFCPCCWLAIPSRRLSFVLGSSSGTPTLTPEFPRKPGVLLSAPNDIDALAVAVSRVAATVSLCAATVGQSAHLQAIAHVGLRRLHKMPNSPASAGRVGIVSGGTIAIWRIERCDERDPRAVATVVWKLGASHSRSPHQMCSPRPRVRLALGIVWRKCRGLDARTFIQRLLRRDQSSWAEVLR